MEELQTENVSNYDRSTSKRANLLERKTSVDEDYSTSGFYVREKNEQKPTDDSGQKECSETSTVSVLKNYEDNQEFLNDKESTIVNGQITSRNRESITDFMTSDKKDISQENTDDTQDDINSLICNEGVAQEGNKLESNIQESPVNIKKTDELERVESVNNVNDIIDVDSVCNLEIDKELEVIQENETAENNVKGDDIHEKENDLKESFNQMASKFDILKDVIEIEEDIQEEKEHSHDEEITCKTLLEDHLSNEINSPLHDEGDEHGNEEDMEYDFDPSLLCPDISMDVDEASVITNEGNNGGDDSPFPYEPVYSTYVDDTTGAEVSFNLTPEEISIKEKLFGPNNQIQYTKIHCTACNVHLGSALDGQKNRFVHPLLKVLICKNCYHFYTSGEFEKDEDGSELYCRWCGQGGQVLCCSSCEFVFCKRCIKNNFGLKKFREIRDSDDWNCFRCDPGQLSILRATCAEFMDYVRKEISRASTIIKDVPSFMTEDHTRCCGSAQKRRESESANQEARRRKRKHSGDDPDYNPTVVDEPEKKKILISDPVTSTVMLSTTAVSPSINILPKSVVAIQPNNNIILRPQGQVFRVGNTTFRPRVQTTFSRPTLQTGAVRGTTPGYIKILPQKIGATRPQNPTYTVIAPSNRPGTKQSITRPALAPTAPHLKHEWFDKTVRAAARVNSNLSYTLTQLNKQTAVASNVEALAVVHNKLQEVLSTSINSLIQIRKNLRTEFISGIKCTKFPAKPTPPKNFSSKDDDDVIFVNPVTENQGIPIVPIVSLSPSITLSTVSSKSRSSNKNPIATTSLKASQSTSEPRKVGYLKVKSFSALQNVPSECITIPDDPPPLTPINLLDEKTGELVTSGQLRDQLTNKGKKTRPVKDSTKLCGTEQNASEVIDRGSTGEKCLTNGTSVSVSKGSDIQEDCEKYVTEPNSPLITFNVTHQPTEEIKKMLNAIVLIRRSKEIEDKIKESEFNETEVRD